MSLSMPIAVSPDVKGFRQDLIDPPISPLPLADGSLEKSSMKKDRPQVLLVEDNPINLKVSPSASSPYIGHIAKSSSYLLPSWKSLDIAIPPQQMACRR
jgi:hypothetical protein